MRQHARIGRTRIGTLTEPCSGLRPPVDALPMVRIGWGYDIHGLFPGYRTVLGGVEFPDFPHGFNTHSDGDVVAHAIIDALAGALAVGSLGDYFPEDDPDDQDARSIEFLERFRPVMAREPRRSHQPRLHDLLRRTANRPGRDRDAREHRGRHRLRPRSRQRQGQDQRWLRPRGSRRGDLGNGRRATPGRNRCRLTSFYDSLECFRSVAAMAR